MPWTFYNANGQRLSSAATNISVLDIDGATALSGAVANEDLFIVDDNASGTNRKVTAAVIKTYIGVPTEATEAVLEEDTPGSSTANTYISPEVAHFHPGVAKAWIKMRATGDDVTTYLKYNISGVGDNGPGDHTIAFDNDLSGGNYAAVISLSNTATAHFATTYAAGGASLRTEIQNASGTNADQQYGLIVMGGI